MPYFAELDENKIVKRVIVIDQANINTGLWGNPANWVETFKVKEGNPRKNYAGIGFQFDVDKNAFIPPKTMPSWVLDDQTAKWKPPIEKPNDGKNYRWNENIRNWEEFTPK